MTARPTRSGPGRALRCTRPGSRRGRRSLLDVDEVGGRVERTELPGGLRVLTETMPGVLSATARHLGGRRLARRESPALAGSSHFLEHLLFKGTRSRSALEIATAMDAVGGEMNAFTAKEHTCYYANVLASDLPLAVTLLVDLVTEACNTAADLESERTVVLEEIAMRDDEPSDAVHDLFSETLFGDTALGRSVLGTVESIEGLTRDDVDGWYRGRYAHAVDRGHRRRPGGAPAGARPGHRRLRRPARRRRPPRAAAHRATLAGDEPARPAGLISRRTEQTHLLLGSTGVGRLDERRYAAAVLDAAVGGGMSSRLFQEIREKRGLVYSVGSALTHYAGRRLASRCTPGARRSGCPRCCGWCARSWPGWPPRGSTPRRWPAAAASSRAAWCSAWRTPARG